MTQNNLKATQRKLVTYAQTKPKLSPWFMGLLCHTATNGSDIFCNIWGPRGATVQNVRSDWVSWVWRLTQQLQSWVCRRLMLKKLVQETCLKNLKQVHHSFLPKQQLYGQSRRTVRVTCRTVCVIKKPVPEKNCTWLTNACASFLYEMTSTSLVQVLWVCVTGIKLPCHALPTCWQTADVANIVARMLTMPSRLQPRSILPSSRTFLNTIDSRRSSTSTSATSGSARWLGHVLLYSTVIGWFCCTACNRTMCRVNPFMPTVTICVQL